MTATCPVCEDYEGGPRQVQAHISGKKDDAHDGRLGRDYNNEIWAEHRESQSEDSDGDDTEPEESEKGSEEETEMPSDSELQAQREKIRESQQVDVGEETDTTEESETGVEDEQPAGIPVELVLIVVLVVGVAFIASQYLTSQGQSRPAEEQENRASGGLLAR